MKKLFILFFIVCVAFLNVKGQDLRFGLTASPNVGWYKIDNTSISEQGPKIGVSYGVMVDFLIGASERYAFSTGLFISHTGSQRSYNYVESIPNFDTLFNDKLQYIELPVTLRLRTNEIGYLTYYGQFGFVPGIKIRGRGDIEYLGPATTTEADNVKLDNINLFNAALYVGGGIEYSLSGNTALIAGLFFNNGFTNIVNDKDGDKISLNRLGLTVGILF